jgi:hypothetical protein
MSMTEVQRMEAAVILTAPKEFNVKDLYILYFRSRDNPRPSEKYFEIQDVKDFRDVITRCKGYCTNMGYRFVKVEKFLSDMAEDERKARQSL